VGGAATARGVSRKDGSMPRFKLIIEYDGGPFVGWQRQANGLSVQEVLEQALFAVSGGRVVAHGAGRTDAGVHATGQVAHVDLARAWSGFRLSEALNAHLVGRPVAVHSAETVADDFEARFSARLRRYRYVIVNRRAPLTLEKGRAWRVKHALDVGAMNEAAQCLVGRRDFSTFRDSQCQARSPVRTLTSFEATRIGERVHLDVSAPSFLHRQVRSMVGSLEHVGSGKWSVADLRDALEAKDRARCGQVAPADGLYLVGVDYDDGGAAK